MTRTYGLVSLQALQLYSFAEEFIYPSFYRPYLGTYHETVLAPSPLAVTAYRSLNRLWCLASLWYDSIRLCVCCLRSILVARRVQSFAFACKTFGGKAAAYVLCAPSPTPPPYPGLDHRNPGTPKNHPRRGVPILAVGVGSLAGGIR